MLLRPPSSTLFPSRRSSDLSVGSSDAVRARAAGGVFGVPPPHRQEPGDRKSTRLNSSHLGISYAVFCLKKKKRQQKSNLAPLPPRHRVERARRTLAAPLIAA